MNTMEIVDTFTRVLNFLLIPALVYIVKIEKRITVLETKCSIYFNNKKE